MSITRRILFGAAASWFSRGVTILLGLVLLPVLFRTLPKEELGLWLLLGQSWATLGILDFGFGVTLTRRIAFAKGKSGSSPTAPLSDETRAEIADLLATGLRLYRGLALLALAISTSLGFLYLRSLELESVALASVWSAWGLLCLSQALALWAAPWACLLQGVGHVGWDAIIGSFVHALTLLAQIAVALGGGSLVALAATAAVGALLQRTAILGFAKRKQPDLFGLRGRCRGELLKSMAPLAWRAWLTGMGATLILYTDQFLIASLQGATEIPAYRAAWVLVHNVTIVAATLGVASGVFVSHLWKNGELSEIHRLLERNLRLTWFTMIASAAVLVVAGESVFALWLGEGNFIGYGILCIFIANQTLGAQSHVLSTMSRATEDEAFVVTSLASGIIKVLLSVCLVRHFGLAGIASATLIAMVVTTDWHMPYRALQRLHYDFTLLARRILLPSAGFVLAIWVSLSAIEPLIRNASHPTNVATVCGVVALLFASAVWWGVLSPAERTKVKWKRVG